MRDAIVDRGSPIQANRTLAALRRMCGRAIEHGLIDVSPCAGIRAPAALGAPCRAMNFRATVSDIFGKFQNDGVREAIREKLRMNLRERPAGERRGRGGIASPARMAAEIRR